MHGGMYSLGRKKEKEKNKKEEGRRFKPLCGI
jgi:hypothetical protein